MRWQPGLRWGAYIAPRATSWISEGQFAAGKEKEGDGKGWGWKGLGGKVIRRKERGGKRRREGKEGKCNVAQ